MWKSWLNIFLNRCTFCRTSVRPTDLTWSIDQQLPRGGCWQQCDSLFIFSCQSPTGNASPIRNTTVGNMLSRHASISRSFIESCYRCQISIHLLSLGWNIDLRYAQHVVPPGYWSRVAPRQQDATPATMEAPHFARINTKSTDSYYTNPARRGQDTPLRPLWLLLGWSHIRCSPVPCRRYASLDLVYWNIYLRCIPVLTENRSMTLSTSAHSVLQPISAICIVTESCAFQQKQTCRTCRQITNTYFYCTRNCAWAVHST